MITDPPKRAKIAGILAASLADRATVEPDVYAPAGPSVRLADSTPEVHRAATDLPHLNIGPGDTLAAKWRNAGPTPENRWGLHCSACARSTRCATAPCRAGALGL